MEVVVTPLDADASIGISTGIDATITNHGRQHLDETQIRVFGQHLLRGIYTTGTIATISRSPHIVTSTAQRALLHRERTSVVTTQHRAGASRAARHADENELG